MTISISPDVWAALVRLAKADDREPFEQIVDALAAQALRDRAAAQAVAQRDRAGDPPWLANAR